jgi:hypothetical protein
MLRAIVALGVVCLLGGCGGSGRVPVTGKLTVAGKPLSGAGITLVPLEPKGPGATGATDENGNFTLMDPHSGGRGAVPGEYKVIVTRWVQKNGAPLPTGAKQVEYPDAHESMPAKLTSGAETPVRTTIPASGGSITIDLPANLFGPAGPPRS